MKKTALILILVILTSLTACSGGNADFGMGKAYTVTFETNGGAEISPLEASRLAEAPKTAKEGHVFCGWFSDEALTVPISYPFKVNNEMTLYARWEKASVSQDFDSVAVQLSYDDSHSYKEEFELEPPEIDLKTLASQGYYVKIDVTYEVYYVKDFDTPGDLGYLGAPDHDVLLTDAYDWGTANKNISTSTEPTAGSISLVTSAESLNNRNFYLRFITHNLQNVVYFENIEVTYTCQPNG